MKEDIKLQEQNITYEDAFLKLRKFIIESKEDTPKQDKKIEKHKTNCNGKCR